MCTSYKRAKQNETAAEQSAKPKEEICGNKTGQKKQRKMHTVKIIRMVELKQKQRQWALTLARIWICVNSHCNASEAVAMRCSYVCRTMDHNGGNEQRPLTSSKFVIKCETASTHCKRSNSSHTLQHHREQAKCQSRKYHNLSGVQWRT